MGLGGEEVRLGIVGEPCEQLVELMLRESTEVLRATPGVVIVEHRLGFVMANAGIDQSNVASPDDPQRALLLPVDPDGSATILRERLSKRLGVPVAGLSMPASA